jgi:hypothetical protein
MSENAAIAVRVGGVMVAIRPGELIIRLLLNRGPILLNRGRIKL